jgi:hypothetical protein
MTQRITEREHTEYLRTTFARQDCIHCGVIFYWPFDLDQRAQNERRRFWCPGCGGTMMYRKSEAERLREELDQERQRIAGLRSEAARQREHRQAAERRVTAMKGVVTRTKKRVAAGKCVRCTTEFPDLAAHMADAHPDYAPDADD